MILNEINLSKTISQWGRLSDAYMFARAQCTNSYLKPKLFQFLMKFSMGQCIRVGKKCEYWRWSNEKYEFHIHKRVCACPDAFFIFLWKLSFDLVSFELVYQLLRFQQRAVCSQRNEPLFLNKYNILSVRWWTLW